MSIIDLPNKTIKYYDSASKFTLGQPNDVLKALENYLKEESLDKKKVSLDTSEWVLEHVLDCPQQENVSDCGVFSCQVAEFISRGAAPSFRHQQIPCLRLKMIFEIASGKVFSL
jgi:sentrin-specific protease 1